MRLLVWALLTCVLRENIRTLERIQGCTYTEQRPRYHTGETAICKTKSEASENTSPAYTLILDFQTPEL